MIVAKRSNYCERRQGIVFVLTIMTTHGEEVVFVFNKSRGAEKSG